MKIGIDAHMLGERETGNERFIMGMLEALHALETDHEFTIFHQKQYADYLANLTKPNFKGVSVHANSIFRNTVELPQHIAQQKLDALYVTYTAPLRSTCPVVVAVHDISFVHYPQYFPRHIRYMLAQIVPRSLKMAHHITTISDYTKQDLIQHYHIPPEKITVTYLSTSPQFIPISKIDARRYVADKYGVQAKFILAVGNLQPRKNLQRLIEAFAQLRQTKQIDHKLVIIGQSLWYANSIFAMVHETGLQDEVIFTGYVSDEDLLYFYNAAELFVYPSLFEGFGLPVLEAMRCGTTVLTSNSSSLPEVVGDAAPLFDPYSVDDIAAKISMVLSDDRLRDEIAQKCLVRAQVFSWQKSAQILLRIFETIN